MLRSLLLVAACFVLAGSLVLVRAQTDSQIAQPDVTAVQHGVLHGLDHDHDHDHAGTEPHRCGFDEAHALRMAQDSEYRASQQAFEQYYQQYLLELAQANKTTDAEDENYFVIPCVVHVVFGARADGRDSLRYEQVASQFQTFFDDFRNVPGTRGWADYGVDMRIEFQLATIDPNGQPTTGVMYYNNPGLASFNRDQENNTLKTTYSWPRSKYFNIWLINNMMEGNPETPSNVLGYAFFPTTGSNTNDGVVCRNDCFGSLTAFPYTAGGPGGDNNLGRTMTHEAGHWVNLFHTFQDDCGTTSCNSSGDRVCDTPQANGETFGNSMSRRNSCTTDSPDLADNPRNYMDYMNDAAVIHFTTGQRARAHAALNFTSFTQRFPLWQSSNLQATGCGPWQAPTSNFRANRTSVYTGSTVQFTDYSRSMPNNAGGLVTWSWEFEGGTPATSTAQHPQVVYNTPGTYDVRLIVNNSSNQPDTLLWADYITVTTGTPLALPYVQGFEGASNFASLGLQTFSPDTLKTSSQSWTIDTSNASAYGVGTNSARISNASYPYYFHTDYLELPPLNLSNANQGVGLRFDVGYWAYVSQTSGGNFARIFGDTLFVFASTDNGLTWNEVWKHGGAQLSWNNLTTPTTWVRPSSNQWKQIIVDLTDYQADPNVLIRFMNKGGFGNNLFVDNVRVWDTLLVNSVSEAAQLDASLRVAPNPFTNGTEVMINLPTASQVQTTVLDMQGRVVLQLPSQQLAAGEQQVYLPLHNQASGLYLVQVQVGDAVFTRRVLKQ
jgi:PKD repeat protein